MDIFLGADFIISGKDCRGRAGGWDGSDAVRERHARAVGPQGFALLPLTHRQLTDPRVKTVAIANELHAPYGRGRRDGFAAHADV